MADQTVSGRGYMLVAHDAVSGPAGVLLRMVASAELDSPLVIVVDGDRSTQELMLSALSGVAKCLDSAARLAFYSDDSDDRIAIPRCVFDRWHDRVDRLSSALYRFTGQGTAARISFAKCLKEANRVPG